MNKKSIILMVGLMFCINAYTKENIYDNCVKQAGTINNTVVSECSNEANIFYKQQINKNYNTIYKALLKQSPDNAKAFELSQKSWLKYRNNHCQLAGTYIGTPMYDYCPMILNEIRSKELKQLAEGF